MTDDDTQISGRLKAVRAELKLSQAGMAEAVGTSVTGWQTYEHGKHVPGGQIIARLVELGFDANWVLTGDGPMRRDFKGRSYEKTGIDPLRFAKIMADVFEVFIEENQKVSGEALGSITSEIYEKVFDLDDNDELTNEIVIEINRLRRAIRAGRSPESAQ
tara:strand:+ start:37450 stop:37929 length:480 start_codon:yes stop_codon:yes gene_type:complete